MYDILLCCALVTMLACETINPYHQMIGSLMSDDIWKELEGIDRGLIKLLSQDLSGGT
jgi:hypothetical protein